MLLSAAASASLVPTLEVSDAAEPPAAPHLHGNHTEAGSAHRGPPPQLVTVKELFPKQAFKPVLQAFKNSS